MRFKVYYPNNMLQFVQGHQMRGGGIRSQNVLTLYILIKPIPLCQYHP